MLRFSPAHERTVEGKYAYLVAQKEHVLNPQVIVTLSTRKLDPQHIGYHRPKVPLHTIEAPANDKVYTRPKFARPGGANDSEHRKPYQPAPYQQAAAHAAYREPQKPVYNDPSPKPKLKAEARPNLSKQQKRSEEQPSRWQEPKNAARPMAAPAERPQGKQVFYDHNGNEVNDDFTIKKP